jgi:predicted O-methyltransferase YrrM
MKEIIQNATLLFGVIRRVGYTMTIEMVSGTAKENLLKIYQVYSDKKAEELGIPADPYIIPKTDIFEILNNDSALYEGVYECGFGHTTEFELKVISNIVKAFQPKTIFEIGTFEGRTTLNMALNSGPETKIITLDLPESDFEEAKFKVEEGEVMYIKKKRSGERFLGHPLRSKIVQVFGDSATFDFTPYSNEIDLVFIDGSHAYEYVVNDTIKALELVRPGGIILWHDYTNWEGVRRALNEFVQKDDRMKGLKHIGGTSIAILEVI